MKTLPLIDRWGRVLGETLVDDDVYEWARHQVWRLTTLGYVCSHNKLLHRTVMEAKGFLTKIDHFNGNRRDNQRSNLRVTNDASNGANRTGANKNSSSGIRGVYPCKRSGTWIAGITLNYKFHHIGRFETVEEARAAYAQRFASEHGYEPKVDGITKSTIVPPRYASKA